MRRAATAQICTASGDRLNVKCCGDLTLRIDGQNIEVRDALCVPKIAANLLSISKITEKDNTVSFVNDGASFEMRTKSSCARPNWMTAYIS